MKRSAKPERKQAASKKQKPGHPEREIAAPEEGMAHGRRADFPIVGIGASAGGLEALGQFLGSVPQGSGMAFVIVPHLDPTHKGIMAELLQRTTPMQVIQVKDRTRVQPDCVYVIPLNNDMSILHGVLRLLAPVVPRGPRLPIDFFFHSLADERQNQSVGVILSGMGSDGTLGLRVIKEKAGVAFVQEPASAKFDSMPRTAVDAGLADVVAPVEELPGKIIAFLQRAPLIAKPGLAQEDKVQRGLDKVVILLRAQTGHDFSLYKRTTVFRRIERRMGIHQIDRIDTYVRFLRENPQELGLLFKELLIGVTSFFRDSAAWEQLKNGVIPALLRGRAPSQTLRAWMPGCATGEEAYSLAIVFREAVSRAGPVEFPATFVPAQPGTPPPKVPKPAANLQSLAEQLLLQCYSPSAVLVNDKGDILYISGRTGKYLEPAAGKANWNIFAMAREGLRHELSSVFQKALRQKQGAMTLRYVVVRIDGGTQALDLTVQSLEGPETRKAAGAISGSDETAGGTP